MSDSTDWRDVYKKPEIAMFMVDVYQMTLMGLTFSLGGIKELEEYWFRTFINEDNKESAAAQRLRGKCDDLRLNAHRIAAVTLVTRFQHWIGKLIKQSQITVTKKRNDPSMLVSQLQALNNKLGDGPVPLQLFDELEEVRNSVIHADSQATWVTPLGNFRKVADQYRNELGEVQISYEQLVLAAQYMIEQVEWYQEQIQSSKP